MVCLQGENALFLFASSLSRDLQISPLDQLVAQPVGGSQHDTGVGSSVTFPRCDVSEK